VTLWWATTPLTETTPVLGPDRSPFLDAGGSGVSVEIECPSPIDGMSTPTVSLPEGAVLEREACERTHSENRMLLWINVMIVLLIGGALVFFTVRSQGGSPTREASPVS
jgi:hypothetical protein